MSNNQTKNKYQIAVMGACEVGKTSIIKQFFHGNFEKKLVKDSWINCLKFKLLTFLQVFILYLALAKQTLEKYFMFC